jgi:hypothetical protein
MAQPDLQLRAGATERRRELVSLVHGRWDGAARDLMIAELDSGQDGVEWITDLTVYVMESGNLALAGELAGILAAAQWGSRHRPLRFADGTAHDPPPHPPEFRVSASKLQHDAAQFRLLRRRDRVGPEFDALADEYERLAVELPADKRVPLPDEWDRRIGHVYNRIVYVADEPRVAEALGPWDRAGVEAEYLNHPPGVVIVDDFLSPDALAGLRRFCAESTVWSSNKYAAGRLGSLFFNGFNCPLLVQIADEVRAAFPTMIGQRHPLTQLWGFKNGARLPADASVHADFAAVNVNFWITPESANLDPDSGGLVVYDVGAPLSWGFADYNESPQRIREYLNAQRPRSATIPYRANRAIIFNSDLFHGTAGLHFRPDYESRRVNITMLFGRRHADNHHLDVSADLLATGRSAWRSQAMRRR